MHATHHSHRWKAYLHDCSELVAIAEPMQVSGRVTRVAGLVMEAVGLKLAVGSACTVPLPNGAQLEAEVVGFEGDRLFLMPQSEVEGIVPGSRVFPAEISATLPGLGQVKHPRRRPSDRTRHLPVGDALLGRVIDSSGRPLDSLGPIGTTTSAPLSRRAANPLGRAPITDILDVGVRAINTMLTVGRGQRMGLFAGSGVGKSVLLGMMARYTSADVIVVGLIGERGREVQEFLQDDLGEEGLARSVVVVATSDEPALMRRQAAYLTLAIAEYFRDEDKDVMCMMDSVTRFAMAQREIGLSAGEPPTAKGYTPTVFTELPKLLERAGPGLGEGTITGIFTVLVDGDDHNEPVADAVRGILDGHIVMQRSIAERGRYPAINILKSVSRTMPRSADPAYLPSVTRARQVMATYADMEELIRLGAYRAGSSPEVDEAIRLHEPLETFLRQAKDESTGIGEGYRRLEQILQTLETER